MQKMQQAKVQESERRSRTYKGWVYIVYNIHVCARCAGIHEKCQAGVQVCISRQCIVVVYNGTCSEYRQKVREGSSIYRQAGMLKRAYI